MRFLGLKRAAVASTLLLSLSAYGEEPQRPAFRHDGGQGKHAEPACEKCHRLDAQGKAQGPGIGSQHDACNGCHAAEFRGEPSRFCFTCHEDARTLRGGRWPVFFPPFRSRGKSEFVLLSFSHGLHMQQQPDCASCHPAKPESKGIDRSRPAHAECAACHAAGRVPEMNACRGCHVQAPGAVQPLASRDWNVYRVNHGFKHDTHMSRAKNCTDCHQKAATPPGQVVPLPSKAECEGCHDGGAAFAVTGTRCGACHVHVEAAAK